MKKTNTKKFLALLLSAGLVASSFQLSPVKVAAEESGTGEQGTEEQQEAVYPDGLTVSGSGIATVATSASAITSESLKSTTEISKFEVEEGNTLYKTTEDGVVLTSADGTELIRYASRNHESGNYPLPEGLTSILSYGCESATDTVGFLVPPTVRSIGDYGFQNSNLQRVIFNEKNEDSQLTTVGAYAFANNTNLEISLPHSVTSIGEYCFAYCANLRETVSLTDEYSKEPVTAGILSRTSITTVPAYCFYQCPNLHNVELPETVTSIGDYAFSGCTNMNTVTFSGTSLESLGTGAFEGNNNLHTIDIPEGVTTISADTFSGCTNLNEIHLPETLTTIEDNAFSDCNNIHEMNIPASVEYIAPSAFNNVTNTNGIDTSQSTYASGILGKTTPSPSPATNLDTATVVPSPTPTPAPSYLKKGKTFTVGKYKYKVTASDTKSASVMLTGYKNKKAKKAQKPRTLTVSKTVKYQKLSYQITSIKASAFKGCKKIKKIVLSNQSTIGSKAFNGCKSVKSVTIKGSKLKKVGKKAFKGLNKKAKIYVPKKYFKKYKKLLKKSGCKKIKKK